MTARLSDMADDELLRCFAGGEAAAFEVLLRRYERSLFTYIRRSVSDHEVAADLLQEAFTRVIQHGHTWNGSAKVSTWIFSIARNLCIDHARRMRRRPQTSLDGSKADADDDVPLIDRIPVRRPDADAEADGATMRERITRAIEALPEEQREVFLLRQLQNMAFSEIAAVVGASENTVKSRMRYALEKLQSDLADYEEQTRAGVG
jgi:RNA polymerase sigma-70 factor (ECF subfamily)